MVQPPPIDYRPAPSATTRRRVFSFAGLLCGSVLSIYMLWMMYRTSLMASIYRDFNLTLPWPTELLIDVTWWLRAKAYYLPLLLPPLLGAFLLPLVDRLLPSDPMRVIRATFALLILVVLLLVLTIVQELALESPMTYLITGMSGGNNKK